MRVNKLAAVKELDKPEIDGRFAFQYTEKRINAVLARSSSAIKYGQGLMNCKAAFSAAALAAAAYAVTLGASWSETVAIPSQVEGAKGSDVPATVNGAGFDRPTASDQPEGGADSLALGGSSASDPMALRSGVESGDDPPVAVGSIAESEPSILTKLLIVFSDLRAQVFGGP